ncbi:MAG TPA: ABC transporter permease [Acidimicrobiales bacterium]|nr:ABC transporter permease [Acidimicrobiales bacterium]
MPAELSAPPGRPTVIEAGVGGASWGETWRSRELLRVMVWRDFTLRYKQTFVGAGWAVLQPLGLTAVFAIFFRRVVTLPVQGLPYAVFMLPAMVLWQFFSKAMSTAGVSLSTNYETVTKVFFPRIYLPFAMIIGGLIDLGFALVATAVVMLFYGDGPGPELLLAPLFVLLAIVCALGFSVWFAAFDARFRDLRLALPFILQLWFFVTPVVYSSATFPYRFRWLYHLNPMAGAVEGFRWSLLAEVPTPAPGGLVLSAVVAVVVTVTGVHYFRRAEGTIVDIL